MKIFRINYGGWDDNGFIELCHRTKNKEDFRKDLNVSFPYVLDLTLNKAKTEYQFISFYYLIDCLSKYFISYLGYEELKLEDQINYNESGMSIIQSSHAGFNFFKSAFSGIIYIKRLKEVFGDAVTDDLIKKIYSYNRKLDDFERF